MSVPFLVTRWRCNKFAEIDGISGCAHAQFCENGGVAMATAIAKNLKTLPRVFIMIFSNIEAGLPSSVLH